MAAPSAQRGNAALRIVDRYVGIPAVALLGLRPKKKELPRFSSLGLLQTAAIGDTVLMGGILMDLRRAFPGARIVLFAGPSNHAAAELLPGVDEVVLLPIAQPPAAIRLLRSRQLDVLCDFGPWPRLNAICSAFSGARFLVGFRTPGQHRHYVYDRVAEHSAHRHELENQRALVRELGVESRSLPHLCADAPLPPGLAPGEYLVFHAWAAGYRPYLKEWPEDYWLELLERVGAFTQQVVFTGGPDDRQRTEELCARLAARCRVPVLSLAGKSSLRATLSVLRNATAVVSVNTSIVHLAAALDAPVVSINGPTNGERWGPVGPKAVSVSPAEPGCGYLNLGFEYRGHRTDCMKAVKPEMVFGRLTELLRQFQPQT